MSAPAQQRLTADPAVMGMWLTYLYAGRGELISLCSDGDGWVGRRFPTDGPGIEAAVAYAMELDRRRRPKGIYAQVSTLREHPGQGERGGEELAHVLTHLWADGDFGTIGHKPGLDDLPAPPDMDAVGKVVAESGLPAPSGWTMSGGGYNPVWMLAEPRTIGDADDRARVKAVTMGWQAILAAQAYRLGWSWDTEVGNLDRLMKLPGSVNRKEGLERPTGLGPPDEGDLHDFDTLADVVAELLPAAREALAQADAEKRQRKAERTGYKTPPPRAPRPDRAHLRSGDGPLDVIADMLDFRDVLEPHGWSYAGQHRDGREAWLRPTAGGDKPSSDYSLLCDDHVAINWSERSDLPVGAQPPGGKLTVGKVYAHLNYGGNTSEAARDIMRAAGGHQAGPAARLPHTVLAEVKRRCLTEPSPFHGFEDLIAPDEEQPPDDDFPDEEPTAPTRRRGLLPETFWNSRAVLQHIRRAAHSHGCSGDAVLYGVLARGSGMLSHYIRGVTGIGGPASLNLFVASVGNSGGGKSIAMACARDLVAPPEDFRDGLPVGTGEGIAETFMGTVDEPTGEIHKKGRYSGDPVTVKVRKQVRHNAFFYVDEGQTLAKLGERTGATLAETLRRAAIGETLGQTNASEERTRYIPAGSYSLGLLAGFQPSIAAPLLADAHTGTPQRFLWGWAEDPAIPDEPPLWPGALDATVWHRRPADSVDVTFPERIRKTLWQQRVARARGDMEVSELDGHAGLIKCKVAALFALLDGRYAVTEDDWGLAETVWESSCAVRDALVLRAQREAEAERQRVEDAKVQQELRTHLAKSDADRALERVAGLVKKHASQVGGITFGYLRRALAGRDRPLLEKAVDLAETRGWVVVEGDRISVNTGVGA